MSSFKFPATYCQEWHDRQKVEQMKYRQLGQTDMIVSQVGIGGTVAGGVYPDSTNFSGIKESFVTALKSGLNFIDTSPFYGEGRSESVIGEILREVPRRSYYLATKVGRYRADMKVGFNFSRETILREFEESLKRLGVSYVDLIQVHDFEFCNNIDQIYGEALVALEEIRKSGKARYIGITGYPLNEFHTVLDNTKIRVDTVLTYARHIFTDMTLQDHIEYFSSKGLGIINASPTGLGLLTCTGPPVWHPASDQLKALCRRAGDYCAENGVELGKLSVFHNLQTVGIGLTLLGFGSLEILNLNLDIILHGLSERELQVYSEIQAKFFTGVSEHWEGVEKASIK